MTCQQILVYSQVNR